MYQEKGKNQIQRGAGKGPYFYYHSINLYAHNIFLVGLIGALEVDEQLELFCP